jgi:hypothetical protein
VCNSQTRARGFPEGARFAPQSADWRMSRLARAMVARVDAAAVRARRLANFRLLAEALSGHAWVRPIWRDAPDGASPWIMPVLARAPSALCAYMLRHGVEAYRVWPHRHPAMPAATDVGAVTPHAVVALRVQHGLSDDDMPEIGDLVGQWHGGRGAENPNPSPNAASTSAVSEYSE